MSSQFINTVTLLIVLRESRSITGWRTIVTVPISPITLTVVSGVLVHGRGMGNGNPGSRIESPTSHVITRTTTKCLLKVLDSTKSSLKVVISVAIGDILISHSSRPSYRTRQPILSDKYRTRREESSPILHETHARPRRFLKTTLLRKVNK